MVIREMGTTMWVRGVLVLALLGAGCSGDDGMSAPTAGATPGGAQDNGLAEEQIVHGVVPAPEDITVEGMLAGHDFPLAERPCTQALCIGASYGIGPTLDVNHAALYVQLGFDSGLDLDTFTRPPLNLSVVVDRSGSMAGEKIASVRTALSRLLDQLDEGDRLSIVLFDDAVTTLLPSTPVTNREAIRELIPSIVPSGSTDLALGLSVGYEEVASHSGEAGRSDRVMVLTDAVANTGTTELTDFVELAAANAAEDIGLTVFGVGTDLNQELVLAVTSLRGGNYYFLEDAARISTVFDEDFDFLVTPLAYDLSFTLTPSADFRVADVYGFGSWQPGAAVQIDVPTVFLSKGHGAIVARLEPISEWPSGKPPIAELSLEYQPAEATARVTETSTQAYEGDVPLGDDLLYYPDPGVRRTVAFVNGALGESTACAAYHAGEQELALALITRTEQLLRAESQALGDDELAAEAAVAAALRSNIQGTPVPSSSYYANDNYYEDDYDEGMACAVRSLSAPSLPELGWIAAGLVAAAVARRRRHHRRSSSAL